MHFSLLIFNIQSNTNVGQLIRTANAFGVDEICVIGKKRFSSYGNQKTRSVTNFKHFYSVDEAVQYYRDLHFDIVGIEITPKAESVNEAKFEKNTAFILGNEGIGLSESQIEHCDRCVFIPQFGAGASLNVNVACGIVLNAFTKNRQDQNAIAGNKFCKSSH